MASLNKSYEDDCNEQTKSITSKLPNILGSITEVTLGPKANHNGTSEDKIDGQSSGVENDNQTVNNDKIIDTVEDESIRVYIKNEKLNSNKYEAQQKMLKTISEFNIKQKKEFLNRKKNIELDVISEQLHTNVDTFNSPASDKLQEDLKAIDEKRTTRREILKTLEEINKKISQVKLQQKEMEDKLQKEMELKAFCKRIQDLVDLFKKNDQVFCDNLKSCKNIEKFTSEGHVYIDFNSKINAELSNALNKCNAKTISERDVLTMEALVVRSNECFDKLCVLSKKIQDECDLQRKQLEEAQLQQEAQHQKQLLQHKKQQEAQHQRQQEEIMTIQESDTSSSNTSNPTKSLLKDIIDDRCLAFYKKTQDYHSAVEKELQDLINDQAYKSFKFQCQKAFNIPINAISAVDSHHMVDKFSRLSSLLSGNNIVSSGKSVTSASSHPQGILYCKFMMAKKFVSQVDVKSEVLFAYASIIIALWQKFPDFGELLLAEFYKQCPYLIPAFWPQLEGQSNEDYYKCLGYQYKDGQVEKQDLFLKRMIGMVQLYAAITVSPTRSNTKHPHNLQFAWKWMSAMLNLEPQPDICATLLFHFINITGHAMHRAYKKQFMKLIHAINTQYLPKIREVTPENQSQQSITLLNELVTKIIKTNHVLPPSGQLPKNFW